MHWHSCKHESTVHTSKSNYVALFHSPILQQRCMNLCSSTVTCICCTSVARIYAVALLHAPLAAAKLNALFTAQHCCLNLHNVYTLMYTTLQQIFMKNVWRSTVACINDCINLRSKTVVYIYSVPRYRWMHPWSGIAAFILCIAYAMLQTFK